MSNITLTFPFRACSFHQLDNLQHKIRQIVYARIAKDDLKSGETIPMFDLGNAVVTLAE